MNLRRNQQGLTLIELMVAVLLAGILSAGLFYMMTGQQRTYNDQLSTFTSQQNLWGAMEFLQRQIRLAGMGFAGCGDTIKTALPPPNDSWRALDIRNNSNMARTAAGATVPNDGTDSFVVRYVDNAGGSNVFRLKEKWNNPMAHCWVTHPETPAPALANGDIVIICQPGDSSKWGSLMQINGGSGPTFVAGQDAWSIPYNPGGGTVYNPPGGHNHFPPDGYDGNAVLINLGGDHPRQFAIDNTVNPPQLVMWIGSDWANREVIAEGIEDLQVAWGCDANNDGAFSEGQCTGSDCTRDDDQNHANCDCSAQLNDEWASNASGQQSREGSELTEGQSMDTVSPTTPAFCNGAPVGAVRVTLIARTASAMMGERTWYRPGAEDHTPGTAADDLLASGDLGTYRRAKLTSVVQPRNLARPQ